MIKILKTNNQKKTLIVVVKKDNYVQGNKYFLKKNSSLPVRKNASQKTMQ